MNKQWEKVVSKDEEVKWARAKVLKERVRASGWGWWWGGGVQNGRCAGQKSPNENGPLRQKLMTRDQKSKISIQHFELFRVAGQLFALQMPLLSIPPLLSLHSSSLQLSPFPFSLCLEQENGPASGLGDRHILSSAERKLCPCKAGDYLPFPTQPRFNGHCGRETNKTKVRKHA